MDRRGGGWRWGTLRSLCLARRPVSGLKRAQAAAPLVVVLVAAMVALLAAINFWNVTGNSCPANVASGLTPTGAFAAIVGAFFVGGLLGKLPHKNPSRGAQLAAGEPVAG